MTTSPQIKAEEIKRSLSEPYPKEHLLQDFLGSRKSIDFLMPLNAFETTITRNSAQSKTRKKRGPQKSVSFCKEKNLKSNEMIINPLFVNNVNIHEPKDQTSVVIEDESKITHCLRYSPTASLPVIETSLANNAESHIEFKGYKIINPRTRIFFFPPKPNLMNRRGWVSWAILSIFFWPLSCLPCFLSCSYDPYQSPIYDYENKEYLDKEYLDKEDRHFENIIK